MKTKHILDEIAEDSGVEALSQAISQLLDRARKCVWEDVVTTSDAVQVLLLTGTASRNSQMIRTSIEWLLRQQSKDTGSWNDEIWDTAAALRALNAVGLDSSSSRVKNGVKAVCDQYEAKTGSWWDIWETGMAIQCFLELRVEEERVHKAAEWLLDKRYPSPQSNWLNLHTTALVLETLSDTDFQWDSRVLEAKLWLESELRVRKDEVDIWSLALSLRALNCYSQSQQTEFVESVVKSRFVPAIKERSLDTVDLCQVCLTLFHCAPTIMRPATLKAMIAWAEKDQKRLADLFVRMACNWTIAGKVREHEEKALKPYAITLGLTARQLHIIGLVAGLASIIGFLVWLVSFVG